MVGSTRRRAILQRLQSDGYVEAKDLALHLGVDTSTIRRDLDALAKAGQVHRTHGGARPMPHASGDIPYAVKSTEQRAQKAAIAVEAANRVRDGETLVLDSGSTTYEVAVALRDRRHLTVITNDLRIAKYVATMPDTRLLVTGGELLGSVFTLIGDQAAEFLADYTADWIFLGADAIHPTLGITNTNTLEVPLKRAMIHTATTTIVVADHTKFGQRTLAKVADLREVDLVITDDGLTATEADTYDAKVTRVTVR